MLEQLPRFILLNGPRKDCHAFATELCDRDVTKSILQDDLSHCLVEGMIQTLYSGAFLEVDIDQPDTWTRILPIGHNTTIEEYIDVQRDTLRGLLGNDILGQIYLKDYLANGYEDLIHTVILRDYDYPMDARPFIQRYGQAALCCVQFQSLTKPFKTPIHHNIHIATTQPKLQVDQLLLDLRQPRAKAANQ
jgi:hypothetical protein